MNHFVSALVGGLAAGAVGLFASSSARQPAVPSDGSFAEPAMRPTLAAYHAQPAAAAPGALLPASASGVTVVRCGPADTPITVRTAGNAPVDVECAAPGIASALAPVTYVPAGAAGFVPAPVAAAPRVVRAAIVDDAPHVVRTVSREAPRRSKAKTALVIGGSTAAGAGIGGLAGGKKGALIGAALGGGGAAIFEALKRK
jgi:hypothetical protein